MGRRKGYLTMIAAALLAVSSLSACSKPQENVQVDNVVDDEFYRITMGYGHTDKTEQYLYVSDLNCVYEMDLDTYEVLPVHNLTSAQFLNVMGNEIYYTPVWDEGVYRYNFEQEQSEAITDFFLTDVYVTEQYTYGLIGRHGVFVRIDNETGEYEELSDKAVLFYAKYGEILYYIEDVGDEEKGVDDLRLWYMNENTKESAQISLDILPITVVAYQDKLYMTECETWDFYEYDLETETLREIDDIGTTYNFCLNHDWLYYSDISDTGATSLLRYSLETGETQVIEDDVVDFSLFADGTIVIQVYEEGYTFVNYYLEEQTDGTWKKTRVLPSAEATDDGEAEVVTDMIAE